MLRVILRNGVLGQQRDFSGPAAQSDCHGSGRLLRCVDTAPMLFLKKRPSSAAEAGRHPEESH